MFSSFVMHWDFALILLFFATAVPILGRRRIQKLLRIERTSKAERLTLYASTVVFQWLAAALILWRSAIHGISRATLGLGLPNPPLAITLAIVLAALILANQLISLHRLATTPNAPQGILPQLAVKLFPQDNTERVAFFVLVVTVSICEELIYRGFAQRVFQDLSRGLVLVGIIGSAVMFAIAHAYQGRRGLISTFIVGLLFSAVRAWSGTLLATAIAHFTADLTAGFLAPSRLRTAVAPPAFDHDESETRGNIKL